MVSAVASSGWRAGRSSTAPESHSRGGNLTARSPLTVVTLTPVTEQTTDDLEIRPELHTTAGKLDDFRDRNRQATVVVAENAAEKQHKRGRKSARERIEMLFDSRVAPRCPACALASPSCCASS